MIERLIAAGIHPTQAKAFADPLHAAMKLNAIDTEARQAAFIAQCMVESANFTRLEENLRYTTERAVLAAFGKRALPHMQRILRNPQAMANFAYANRNGNGPEESGDGWVYRGRGLFQLTGRANYKAASEGVGLGAVYLWKPELVAQPSDACLTAAWYWRANGCNQAVDAGMFDTTTRIINGKAMMHAQQRAQAFASTLAVFSGALA
jgi:putative chitinase